MRNNLLLAAGLLALPRLGAAQTAAPPRFYVGAGVSMLTAWPFHKSSDYHPVGPSLTAGLQLSPRLALQVGASVGWNRYQFNSSYGPASSSSGSFFYSSEGKSTSYAVPVLLRYTLTSGASPLHFDVLGGGTLLHARGHQHDVIVNDGQTTFDRAYNYTNTNANLTLGPAVRYALTPALELSATPLVNFVLNPGYSADFGDRLTSNFLLGVNYKFGQ